MVWFLGALSALTEETQPRLFGSLSPNIEWDNSHVLGSAASAEDFASGLYSEFNDDRKFLPEGNAHAFLDAMKRYYSEEKILQLAERFSADEHIAISTYRIPEMLMAKLHP